jgi:hypothetical protein
MDLIGKHAYPGLSGAVNQGVRAKDKKVNLKTYNHGRRTNEF